jgi:hypothetical protein
VSFYYIKTNLSIFRGFPSNRDDLETTSLGLTVIDDMDTATKHKVMDEMLQYRDADGIIQVYYDHSRPRIGDCFEKKKVRMISYLTCLFYFQRSYLLREHT